MAERSSTGDDLAIENCSTSRLRRKTAGLPRGGGSWKEVAWPTGRCRGDTPLLPPMRGRYAPRTPCKVRAMNKKDYAFAEMAAQRALCPPPGLPPFRPRPHGGRSWQLTTKRCTRVAPSPASEYAGAGGAGRGGGNDGRAPRPAPVGLCNGSPGLPASGARAHDARARGEKQPVCRMVAGLGRKWRGPGPR